MRARPCAWLSAVLAESEEFVAMVDDLEVLFFGLCVLQFFDLVILEFNDFPTTDADEVVVVFTALASFVKLLPVPKILFFKDLAVF